MGVLERALVIEVLTLSIRWVRLVSLGKWSALRQCQGHIGRSTAHEAALQLESVWCIWGQAWKPRFEKWNFQSGELRELISGGNWTVKALEEVMWTLASLWMKCGILSRPEQRSEVIYVLKGLVWFMFTGQDRLRMPEVWFYPSWFEMSDISSRNIKKAIIQSLESNRKV